MHMCQSKLNAESAVESKSLCDLVIVQLDMAEAKLQRAAARQPLPATSSTGLPMPPVQAASLRAAPTSSASPTAVPARHSVNSVSADQLAETATDQFLQSLQEEIRQVKLLSLSWWTSDCSRTRWQTAILCGCLSWLPSAVHKPAMSPICI